MIIEWADRASKQFVLTLTNLEEFVSFDYAQKVARATIDEADKLLRFPNQWRIAVSKFGFDYRKMVVLRRYVVFYRVTDETVRIVAFVDGRNQPDIDAFMTGI